MPYTAGGPGNWDQGRSAAGAAVGDGLQKMLARWDEDRKKKEIAEGMLEGLAATTDAEGKPYVPVEVLGKWHSMHPDKQIAALSIPMARAMADAKQSQESKLALTAEQQAAVNDAGYIAMPQSRGQLRYLPKGGPGGATTELPTPGSPVLDNEGNQIGVWDAKGKIAKVGGAKSAETNPMAQLQQDMRKEEIASYDEQITRLQREIQRGEKKWGPDMNPFATSYSDQIEDLRIKRAKAETLIGGGAAPAATDSAQPALTRPAAAPAPAGGKVRMKSPDGKTGFVPASQLEEALAAGYTRL